MQQFYVNIINPKYLNALSNMHTFKKLHFKIFIDLKKLYRKKIIK